MTSVRRQRCARVFDGRTQRPGRGALGSASRARAVRRARRRKSAAAWDSADADFVLLAEEAGRAALPEPLARTGRRRGAGAARGGRWQLRRSRSSWARRPGAAYALPWRTRCSPYVNVPPAVTHWLVCQRRCRAPAMRRPRSLRCRKRPSMPAGAWCAPLCRARAASAWPPARRRAPLVRAHRSTALRCTPRRSAWGWPSACSSWRSTTRSGAQPVRQADRRLPGDQAPPGERRRCGSNSLVRWCMPP